MTELFEVQASSYTDSSSELSLTELGRVAIKEIGWMVASDNLVYTEDGQQIGSITAISQVLSALDWITYSEPRPDYLQTGLTAVNWSRIPRDFHNEVRSYDFVDKFRFIIDASYDVGITRAIELQEKGISIEVLQEAIQNGIDHDLLDSLIAPT